MQTIAVNSPEHRALKFQAITQNEIYILQQLKEAKESGLPYLRLLNGFEDELIITGTIEDPNDPDPLFNQAFNIFLNKDYFDFRDKQQSQINKLTDEELDIRLSEALVKWDIVKDL